MNFTVIDGDQEYRSKLPDFVDLYNNKNIPVTKIKSRLKLGTNEYRKLRRDAIEEGLITLRTKPYNTKKPTYKTNPRYVSKSTHGNLEYYIVTKTINGKHVFYGSFKDIRQADRMVELLKECNWDRSKRKELKEQVLNESKIAVL